MIDFWVSYKEVLLIERGQVPKDGWSRAVFRTKVVKRRECP